MAGLRAEHWKAAGDRPGDRQGAGISGRVSGSEAGRPRGRLARRQRSERAGLVSGYRCHPRG